MATEVYVGLGSNLGDRAGIIRAATEQVASLGSRAIVSSLYATAPIGPPQPFYVNAVVRMSTIWTPAELLRLLQRIETRFGRCRRERWGPRTLDCDLLVYGRWTMNTPALTLPHPRLRERRFVLEPMAEIDAGLRLPGGTWVLEALAQTLEQEVKPLADAVGTHAGH
ncbi:MAG: 2-amino-4-hydroxy-6-hydroxymethyldihydropteridine diphosphokinase [Firmicutes bacterium]|nr:2-amino-4-hydroxy-6-hydroxymethyldihydropteridine diphosphokinase [Bacillota bacterium]